MNEVKRVEDMTYEERQLRFCSNSRHGRSSVPGKMGRRLVATVTEAWPAFKAAGGPILDVGCGDGLGMETFLRCAGVDKVAERSLPTRVRGVEVTAARVETARSLGLNVEQGMAEEALAMLAPESHEIFCSHMLEHAKDRAAVLKEIWRVGRRLVWIAVPIEKNGTGNKAHFSPVRSLEEMLSWVPDRSWEMVRLEQRFNLEQEGVLVCKRRT